MEQIKEVTNIKSKNIAATKGNAEDNRFSDVYQLSFDSTNNGYGEFMKLLDFLEKEYDVKHEYGMPLSHCPESLSRMIERSNNYFGVKYEKRDILGADNDNTSAINQFLNYLNKITISTNKLVIVDNYIFPKKYSEDYRTLLLDIFKRCKKGVVLTKGDYNQRLFKQLKEELIEFDCNIDIVITESFHDRFYLSDSQGFVLGTSLNGLGKRMCLIDYLQPRDFITLVKKVNSIKKIF